MLAILGQALGALQRQLGDAAVVLDGVVEGGCEDLAADGAAHVGDLLRALAGEDNHDVEVVVVGGEAACDELQQEGLARLGRRHDEGPLPPADGRDEVDEALGQVLGRGLQLEVLAGVDGDEAVEVGAGAGLLRLDAVDGLDADEAEVALAVLGRADLAGDGVAGAEHEASDLGLRDVDVAGAGAQAVLSQEAVAVAHDLQEAGRQNEALPLRDSLEDAQGELLPAESAVLQAQAAGQVYQLILGLGVKLGQADGAVDGHGSPLHMWFPNRAHRPLDAPAGTPTAAARSQSRVKAASPAAVRGGPASAISTLKGMVAMCAPAIAASMQCSGWRMLAASTCVGRP